MALSTSRHETAGKAPVVGKKTTLRPVNKSVRLVAALWLLVIAGPWPQPASSAPTPQRQQRATGRDDFYSGGNGLASNLRYGVAPTEPPDISQEQSLDSQPDAFYPDELPATTSATFEYATEADDYPKRAARFNHPTIHIIDNGGRFAPTSPMPVAEEEEEEEEEGKEKDRIFSIVIQQNENRERSAFISPDVDWLRQLASQISEVADESETRIRDAVFRAIDEDEQQLYVNVVKSSVESSDQVPDVMESFKDLFETGGIAVRRHYRYETSQPKKNGLVLNVVVFNVVAEQDGIRTSIQAPDVKITPSQGPANANEKDSYIEAWEESRKPLQNEPQVTNLGRDGLKDIEPSEDASSLEASSDEKEVVSISNNSPRGPFFVGRKSDSWPDLPPWELTQLTRMELDYLRPDQVSNDHEQEEHYDAIDGSVPSFLLEANYPDFEAVVVEETSSSSSSSSSTSTTTVPTTTKPVPVPSPTQRPAPTRANNLRNRIQQLGFVGVPLLAGLGALSMVLPTAVGRKKRAILLQQLRGPEHLDERIPLPKAIEDREILALLMGARYKNLTKDALQYSIDTWKDRDKEVLYTGQNSGISISSTRRPIWVARPGTTSSSSENTPEVPIRVTRPGTTSSSSENTPEIPVRVTRPGTTSSSSGNTPEVPIRVTRPGTTSSSSENTPEVPIRVTRPGTTSSSSENTPEVPIRVTRPGTTSSSSENTPEVPIRVTRPGTTSSSSENTPEVLILVTRPGTTTSSSRKTPEVPVWLTRPGTTLSSLKTTPKVPIQVTRPSTTSSSSKNTPEVPIRVTRPDTTTSSLRKRPGLPFWLTRPGTTLSNLKTTPEVPIRLTRPGTTSSSSENTPEVPFRVTRPGTIISSSRNTPEVPIQVTRSGTTSSSSKNTSEVPIRVTRPGTTTSSSRNTPEVPILVTRPGTTSSSLRNTPEGSILVTSPGITSSSSRSTTKIPFWLAKPGTTLSSLKTTPEIPIRVTRPDTTLSSLRTTPKAPISVTRPITTSTSLRTTSEVKTTPEAKMTTEVKTTVKRSTDSIKTTYQPFEGREDPDDEDTSSPSAAPTFVTPIVPPLNEDYDIVQSFFTATLEKLANDDGKGTPELSLKGPVIVNGGNTVVPTKPSSAPSALSTLSIFSSEPVMPQNSPATNSPVTYVSPDSRPVQNLRPRPIINRFSGFNNWPRPRPTVTTTTSTSSTSTATSQGESVDDEDNNIVENLAEVQIKFDQKRPAYVYQTTPDPGDDVPIMTVPFSEPAEKTPNLPAHLVINPYELPVRPTVRPSISLLTMHRDQTEPSASSNSPTSSSSKQTTTTTTTWSSNSRPPSTSPAKTTLPLSTGPFIRTSSVISSSSSRPSSSSPSSNRPSSSSSSAWPSSEPSSSSTWSSEPSAAWSSTNEPLYTWSSSNDPSHSWTLNSQSSTLNEPSSSGWISTDPPFSTLASSTSGRPTRPPTPSRRPVSNKRPSFTNIRQPNNRPGSRPQLVTIQDFQISRPSSLPPPMDISSGPTSSVDTVKLPHGGIVTSEPYDYYSTVSNGGSALVSDVINEQNFIIGLLKGTANARPVISPSGLHSGVGTSAPNRVTGAPSPIQGTNAPNYVITGTNPPLKISGTNPPSNYGEPPSVAPGTNAPWRLPIKKTPTPTTTTTTPSSNEESDYQYYYPDSASILSLKNTTKPLQIDGSGTSLNSTPYPTIDMTTVLSQLKVNLSQFTTSHGGPYFVNSSTDVVILHPIDVTPPSDFDYNQIIPGRPYDKPYKPLPIVEAIVAEEASAVPVDPEVFVNAAFPDDDGQLVDTSDAILIDAGVDGNQPDSVPVVSNNANIFFSSGSSSSISSTLSSDSSSSSSDGVSVQSVPTVSLSNIGSMTVIGATALAATAVALSLPLWVPFLGKKRRSYGPAKKKEPYLPQQYPIKIKQTFGEPPADYYYEDSETTAYKKKQSFAEPPPNYYKDHPEYTADYDIVERSVPSSREDTKLDSLFSDPGAVESEELYGPATVFLRSKRRRRRNAI